MKSGGATKGLLTEFYKLPSKKYCAASPYYKSTRHQKSKCTVPSEEAPRVHGQQRGDHVGAQHGAQQGSILAKTELVTHTITVVFSKWNRTWSRSQQRQPLDGKALLSRVWATQRPSPRHPFGTRHPGSCAGPRGHNSGLNVVAPLRGSTKVSAQPEPLKQPT